MPKWIHDRAEHIQEKNPDMPESQAFAIATQQSHALGKSPKGYGTAEGKRVAKAKYDGPRSSYKKTASMHLSDLDIVKLAGLLDELDLIEKDAGWLRKAILPVALAASIGGGGKIIKNIATKAPTAMTMKAAPTVAKGMGGLSHAASDVREFMP